MRSDETQLTGIIEGLSKDSIAITISSNKEDILAPRKKYWGCNFCLLVPTPHLQVLNFLQMQEGLVEEEIS